MVASYNSVLSTKKDVVRFELQDVDISSPLVQDEEILYFLSQYNQHVLRTAAHMAEAISRKFAVQATSISTPDLRVELTERATLYAQLAQELRRRTETALPLPFAGGISQSDKETRADNTDREPNTFWRGMHDDPETSTEA